MQSDKNNKDDEMSDDDIEVVDIDEAKPAEADAELKKAKNDYLYLAAEFDNYKKNAIKERSELLRYGGERLARELLAVLDNFDRALDHDVTPETLPSFLEGMKMTAQNFRTSLQKFGIQEVESLGQPFDPMMHEAIGSEETADIEPGHVVRELRKAFKIHDRLLRPAQVIVAKAPAPGKG